MGDELEAGPALDARIAQRVMGLHQHRDGYRQPYWCRTPGGDADACSSRGGYVYPPCYSTDLATAWRLVEHLAARWRYGGVYWDEGVWTCAVEAENDQDVEGTGPTPALAICRAVLAASEEESVLRGRVRAKRLARTMLQARAK